MAGSSLVPFHRVLISAAIAFCAGFAWWMFTRGNGESIAYQVIGIVFAILAVLLAVYLWNLGRVLGYDDRDRP
jgi:hypothetical protein